MLLRYIAIQFIKEHPSLFAKSVIDEKKGFVTLIIGWLFKREIIFRLDFVFRRLATIFENIYSDLLEGLENKIDLFSLLFGGLCYKTFYGCKRSTRFYELSYLYRGCH
jgi:hypothetical protein